MYNPNQHTIPTRAEAERDEREIRRPSYPKATAPVTAADFALRPEDRPVGYLVHGDPECSDCWRPKDGGDPLTRDDAAELNAQCSICGGDLEDF